MTELKLTEIKPTFLYIYAESVKIRNIFIYLNKLESKSNLKTKNVKSKQFKT